jgi:hypothetical protein
MKRTWDDEKAEHGNPYRAPLHECPSRGKACRKLLVFGIEFSEREIET